MKMSAGGNWLKPAEAVNGSFIRILDEGEWKDSDKFFNDDGSPQKMCIFKVEYEGKELFLRMNKISRVAMIEAFGDESKDWIGKRATIVVIPTAQGNHKQIILNPVDPIKQEDCTPDENDHDFWDE